MHRLVSLLVHETGVSPGVVAVVGEGEGPGPQSVVHPQHRQTRAYAVTTLHCDHTGDPPRLVH